jgi:hypothetical protein
VASKAIVRLTKRSVLALDMEMRLARSAQIGRLVP